MIYLRISSNCHRSTQTVQTELVRGESIIFFHFLTIRGIFNFIFLMKKKCWRWIFFLSNFSGRNLCLLAHVFNFDSLQEVDQGDATPTWTVDQRTARPERPSIWLRKLQKLWKRKNTSINSVLVVGGKIGNDLINFTNYGKNWHNAGKVGWLRGRL